MITFHRMMFAFVITVAFFKGAVDEGRKDLIAELLRERIALMSIYELTEYNING